MNTFVGRGMTYGTGIIIFSTKMPSSHLTVHCPSYFSAVLLMLDSPKPWRKESSLVVLPEVSAPGRALFSTAMTIISWMRRAFTVMTRRGMASFSLASMALSRALPKIVLMSSGSRKAPSSKWMTAVKSICFSRAVFALSRMMTSR